MNVNLQPQTLEIKDWLNNATSQLSGIGIISSRLDAEIILSHSLGENRTYLHAHGNKKIDDKIVQIANKKLALRLNRIPIAYIVGYKEFYGRNFNVNKNTLIPRPESEDIIDILKKILLPNTYNIQPTKLVDVGTGCGCLGITAKLEFSNLDVTLTDISKKALMIAKRNAKKLLANVHIIKNDLLINCIDKFDIIIANLPYVDKSWDRSPETNYEPSLSLFATDSGLSQIKKLILDIHNSLNTGGDLIIEADPVQHDSIIKLAKKQSLVKTHQNNYVVAFKLDSQKNIKYYPY